MHVCVYVSAPRPKLNRCKWQHHGYQETYYILTTHIFSPCSFLLNFSTRCDRLPAVTAFTVGFTGFAVSLVRAVWYAVPNCSYRHQHNQTSTSYTRELIIHTSKSPQMMRSVEEKVLIWVCLRVFCKQNIQISEDHKTSWNHYLKKYYNVIHRHAHTVLTAIFQVNPS